VIAQQDIVPVTSPDRIVALPAEHDVVPGSRIDRVVTAPGIEHGDGLAHRPDLSVRPVARTAATQYHHLGTRRIPVHDPAAVAEDQVVTRSPDDGVTAHPAKDHQGQAGGGGIHGIVVGFGIRCMRSLCIEYEESVDAVFEFDRHDVVAKPRVQGGDGAAARRFQGAAHLDHVGPEARPDGNAVIQVAAGKEIDRRRC